MLRNGNRIFNKMGKEIHRRTDGGIRIIIDKCNSVVVENRDKRKTVVREEERETEIELGKYLVIHIIYYHEKLTSLKSRENVPFHLILLLL